MSGFDARVLDRRYAFLDECPEGYLDVAVALPVGKLEERVRGIRDWRLALLNGQTPPEASWPGETLARPMRQALRDLKLLHYCQNQPELVDELLHDILAGFAEQEQHWSSEALKYLQQLQQDELERLEAQEKAEAKQLQRQTHPVHLDADTLARLKAMAREKAAAGLKAVGNLIHGHWRERANAWGQIADVFGDLGEMLGGGRGLAQSVLKHTGWKDLERLRKLLEKLPQLRKIIQSLGRIQDSDDKESVSETILVPMQRLEEEIREIPTPLIPGEMRGIERTGNLSRMLPVEAVALGHPQLRFLWHARRSENALLGYRVEGVDIERVQVTKEYQEEREQKKPRPERGPIIVVQDTSGSMSGGPEEVSKALVLEALRTAHKEKRRCYLYAFSGKGQVSEHELSLSEKGLGRLLKFLGMSFGGGTDIDMLEHAVIHLKRADWKKADVLVVTDGQWNASQGLLRSVESAKKEGNRFHGVQVGSECRSQLATVCDPVHRFEDWRALG